jgi:predicted nucleic acid-binding protein
MAAERILVDTNVLLRFFCGEPADQAAKAKRLIARADRGEITLMVTPVVLAETFYTLQSFYQMNSRTIAEKLGLFLNCKGIDADEKESLLGALALCRDKNAHFADAFLAALANQTKMAVASFDKDFDRFPGITRIEPR